MTDETIKITAWAMGVDNSNPFRAPEARPKFFAGIREDGQRIQTAFVERKLGPRLFLCGVETVELVGDPEQGYADFCAGIGRPIDPADPIKLIGTVRPIEIRNAVTRYAERRHMLRFSASDDGGSHFTVQWANLGAARFPYSLAGLCDACGWIDAALLRDVGELDPAGRLALMADLAAGLPYQRSEHSAKPDLSLGVSAEAYALVRSIPGAVDLTASECGPGEAWVRIGVLGVGATEPGKETE